MFDLRKAAAWQEKLSSRLCLAWDQRQVRLVGGVDASFNQELGLVGAVAVTCQFPGCEIVEVSRAINRVAVPYIPGYLNFREGPAFIQALRCLRRQPDVTLVDGNGIAHPRAMGLASFVGVILNVCTIGCAKKPFFPVEPPELPKGAYTPYKNREGTRVGVCLRTRTNIKPVFVSPGHKIDIVHAREITLACSKFRIPEPIRYAHHMAKDLFMRRDMPPM